MASLEHSLVSRWRRNLMAGLAITMPGILTLALVVWIFRNVSSVTDTLLFFLPKKLTHPPGDPTPYWYWSVAALVIALFLIGLVGRFGREYFGRRAISWMDDALMSIPLLNKIYGTIKQVNESFSNNKSALKYAVEVPFPHPGSKCLGFVTGETRSAAGEKLLVVFVPTTPIPTSGFLLLFLEKDITKLDMTVADGIKFIISLGALNPGHLGQTTPPIRAHDSGDRVT